MAALSLARLRGATSIDLYAVPVTVSEAELPLVEAAMRDLAILYGHYPATPAERSAVGRALRALRP